MTDDGRPTQRIISCEILIFGTGDVKDLDMVDCKVFRFASRVSSVFVWWQFCSVLLLCCAFSSTWHATSGSFRLLLRVCKLEVCRFGSRGVFSVMQNLYGSNPEGVWVTIFPRFSVKTFERKADLVSTRLSACPGEREDHYPMIEGEIACTSQTGLSAPHQESIDQIVITRICAYNERASQIGGLMAMFKNHRSRPQFQPKARIRSDDVMVFLSKRNQTACRIDQHYACATVSRHRNDTFSSAAQSRTNDQHPTAFQIRDTILMQFLAACERRFLLFCVGGLFCADPKRNQNGKLDHTGPHLWYSDRRCLVLP